MRGSAARSLLPALAVLALVALVAIAATGSTPGGSADARAPGDTLLDALFSLLLVAFVVGSAMFLYALTQREAIARELASGRYRRLGFVTFLAFLGVFTAFVYYGVPREWAKIVQVEDVGELPFPGEAPSSPTGGEIPSTYEPAISWPTVAVVLALGAVAAAAAFLALRRRPRPMAGEEQALVHAVARVLDETLDDLRAEADPRRAVIAAYARFEDTLAAHGLARRVSETPEEYVSHILGSLEVGERSVRRLTDLFEEAKFSDHRMDAGMKEEAIGALQEVRDELRSIARERSRPSSPLSTRPA